MRNPLKPPRRPSWRSELTTAQFGPIAEDLLTVPIQVKGCRHVSLDAVVTEEIAVEDLHHLSGGYLAMVHVPPA